MILMRLVCRESSRVREVPFQSPGVQRLQRPILVPYVTPDWSFSSGVRNLFVFRAYPTMRVRLCFIKYVICVWVVCVEIVSPDL